MSTPEHRLFASGEKITAGWISRQRTLNDSTVRMQLTGMAQRSARVVFGGDLENEALHTLHKSVGLKGPKVGAEAFHLAYATIVGSVARAMQWDEGNPHLTLFCAGLYERIVERRIERIKGTDQPTASLEQTKEKVAKAITSYRERQKLAGEITEASMQEVDQLLAIFDIRETEGKKKRKIYQLLQDPATRSKGLQKIGEFSHTS